MGRQGRTCPGGCPCFCPFLKNGSLRQSTEVEPAQLPGLPQCAVENVLLWQTAMLVHLHHHLTGV